jgi:V/A-type H+-transporting ATPase subunit I
MYSLPNYHDIDPLPLFAPFFMLFFGLCMGDMGYGLLITVISLVVILVKPSLKSYGQLGALLGGMTCICGLITGTFFGIDLAKVDWSWIQPVQPYFVNDSMKDSFFGYSPMMVISVIVGLVQVLIGMFMAGCKAVKNYGFIYGVGKFSWVLALICLVVLFGLPLFGVVLPVVMQYVLYALVAISAFGIYFLNNPAAYAKEGSLKKMIGVGLNLGSGLWATYGMSTGLLGDLLSYIRLFALGLTGGVLGSVFNSLAVDMSPQMPVVHELVMVIILLLGHAINFGLCMISSFVHPMRLTFVEYFKNAEFDGNGKEYEPFKIKTK